MRRLVTLAALLAGCLDVPSGPAQECVSNKDCDSASGEICDEGVCWGNPPVADFAVVISPPASRKDLVPRELTAPVIATDGWIDDLTLDTPAFFAGRIEATCATPQMTCDHTSVAAAITISRPSAFHGGPGFNVVAQSTMNVDPTTHSFEIALPKTGAADADYAVTVMPAGRGDTPDANGATPAQLYPPAHFTLSAKDNSIARTVQLGGSQLPTIDGAVLAQGGAGLAQYRVVAMGSWDGGSAPTEVSTIAYTGADGRFHLTLAAGISGKVEVVAKPYANGVAAPTLHLANVPSSVSSPQLAIVQPADLGYSHPEQLTVRGVDGSGAIAGVRGARVKVSATVGTPTGGLTYATFSAEGTADDSGNVTLDLLDGTAIAKAYKLAVTPPASSSMGVLFDVPFTDVSLAPLLLPTRVAIKGRVVDFDGNPLDDVSVTARPSLRFAWSFADVPQAFVTSIPASTTLTPETGEFALYVDPTIDGLWGHYDLAFDPATKARAPSWVEPDIEIPRDSSQTTIDIGEIRLPDAAAVRGTVLDPAGGAVEGAEVKIFRLSGSLALCNEVLNAPASCPIPALLEGRGDSDAQGVVRMTLPR